MQGIYAFNPRTVEKKSVGGKMSELLNGIYTFRHKQVFGILSLASFFALSIRACVLIM
jgi:hypothetical protein